MVRTSTRATSSRAGRKTLKRREKRREKSTGEKRREKSACVAPVLILGDQEPVRPSDRQNWAGSVTGIRPLTLTGRLKNTATKNYKKSRTALIFYFYSALFVNKYSALFAD